MPWNLDSDRPIFIQIIDRIQADIIAGCYQPGDKLPSVRELAQDASVNPNTMQKALSELERTGLVYSQRTSGRFITEDREMIRALREQQGQEIAQHFVENMKKLGYEKDEILTLLTQLLEIGTHGQNVATHAQPHGAETHTKNTTPHARPHSTATHVSDAAYVPLHNTVPHGHSTAAHASDAAHVPLHNTAMPAQPE